MARIMVVCNANVDRIWRLDRPLVPGGRLSCQSIEERYGTLDGYVCRVTKAADALVRDRLLLTDDRDRIVAAAAASHVLPAGAQSSPELRAIAARACQ